MLTIPEKQKAAVRDLVKLPHSSIMLLSQSLKSVRPAASLQALAERIARQENSIANNRKIERILGVVASLGTAREEMGIDAEEIAVDLINAIKADASLGEPKDGWEQLKSDIKSLLEMSGAAVISRKAAELVGEHEHLFCPINSRVVSDIRAVFAPGDIATPDAAVIVHMLKLAYHVTNSEDREFYVALSSDDIRHLKDVLDRAIQKEKPLKKLIKKSGMRVLDSEDD